MEWALLFSALCELVCYIFLFNTPNCILVYSALSLLCFCGRVERPLVYPLLRTNGKLFSHPTCTHGMAVYLLLQAGMTSYATTLPASFFFIVRSVVLECLRRMRCISLWSVCPRGPLRPILSSTRLELCTSLARAADAPAPPVACPLDPAPRRAWRGCSVETQVVCCARTGNMWI